MTINYYKSLISNLPVREQSFMTKRKTWKKAENEIEWLKTLNDRLFGENSTLTISRQDIFDKTDIREKIILTIYWGYPRGMRGKHFINLTSQINRIEKTLRHLSSKESPKTSDFLKMTVDFKEIAGLGLSTYSKILYFSDKKFNENPCLFLDQRLIDVFANKTFSEFLSLYKIRYDNAEKKYLEFLELTEKTSKKLDSKGENIEQFLFIFGNNLKRIQNNNIKISNIWNGYCPESMIQGENVKMRLNSNDFFESESTGLQIKIIPGVQAIILNFRGNGKFKSTKIYGQDIANGEILSPQNLKELPFNNGDEVFKNKSALETYISKIDENQQ